VVGERPEAAVDAQRQRHVLWHHAVDGVHSYRGLGNLLLIGAQAPQATRVAGFRTWQSLGRQVRKGERGIAILAPCTYRPTTAERPEPAAPAGPEPATTSGGGVAPDAGDKKQVRGFRVVHVFALHQTEGAPLPDVAPSLLVGQAPAGLWDAQERQVLGHGYAVHRGDTGRANGWTDPTSCTVRVSSAVDDAQAVKTLIHELAHLEAGHVADLPTYVTCRGRCEVEADAYVVAAAHGLDASGYTFAYVAGWAGGDLTLGHRGIWPVDAQRVRRCAGGMAHLERGDAQRAQFDRMTVDVLGDADGEAALHTARPGEQDLHRLLEPGTGAGWAEDGEVAGTAAELRVEHQERQATEVVAVQLGEQHRLDLEGVDLLLAQRGQAGRSAVQQHARCVDLVSKPGRCRSGTGHRSRTHPRCPPSSHARPHHPLRRQPGRPDHGR
jgi:antirestriction protein ArdC